MKKQSSEEKVYLKIRSAIAAREIAPGQQLIENTISAHLGISRSPVRNALQRLANEGFVKIIKNRGAFVANPTHQEMHQTYTMRRLLEKYALEEAAARMTPVDFTLLRELVEAEKVALQNDDSIGYLDINKEFHMHIAKRSESRFLIEFIERLINETNIYVILFDSFFIEKSYRPRGTESHLAIISLLEKKNIPDLLEAMDIHLNSAMESTTKQENPYKNLDAVFNEIQKP